jgi:hypothetical protein
MDFRYEEGEGHDAVVVTLSRRNLRTLLAKLDGHPPGSARAIMKDVDRATTLVVRAEEDDAHYADRPPGAMHPLTEAEIVRAGPVVRDALRHEFDPVGERDRDPAPVYPEVEHPPGPGRN